MVELACACMSTLEGSTEKHWYHGEYAEISDAEREALRIEHEKVCKFLTAAAM